MKYYYKHKKHMTQYENCVAVVAYDYILIFDDEKVVNLVCYEST